MSPWPQPVLIHIRMMALSCASADASSATSSEWLKSLAATFVRMVAWDGASIWEKAFGILSTRSNF